MKLAWFKFDLIPDIENFWRFASIRFGLVAGACCAGMAAYAAARGFDPRFVVHFPQWLLDLLAYGSVAFGIAAFVARGIDQPALRK